MHTDCKDCGDRCVSSEASEFEKEFAKAVGFRFAMAVNSCGSAMFLALRAAGVKGGDAVLVNTFTLTPVPSCIVHAGGRPVFVEGDSNLHLDLEDLRFKARASRAPWLLLSHMRGHISDMDAISQICTPNPCVLVVLSGCMCRPRGKRHADRGLRARARVQVERSRGRLVRRCCVLLDTGPITSETSPCMHSSVHASMI